MSDSRMDFLVRPDPIETLFKSSRTFNDEVVRALPAVKKGPLN